MNDFFERAHATRDLASEHEHVLDSAFSPGTRRVVLFVYATVLVVAGAWLLLSPSPEAAPPSSLVRIGVLGGPEADVLERVKTLHPELGLELVAYDDPRRINDAVANGELHAASFQNGVSFEAEVAKRALPLAQAGLTVTLPLGFYSRNLQRLDELSPGARVALSVEPVAQGRALLVLYHYGLIDFGRDVGPDVRITDVTKNPRELVLETLSRARLLPALDEAALVALEYDDAIRAKLEPARHALGLEDAFTPFAQVLSVRKADQASPPPWLSALLSAYREQPVKELILKRFEDSVRRPW